MPFFFARDLVRDRRGATAIEYGIMGAMIAIALLGAFVAFGESITATFTGVESDMSAATAQ